MFERRALALPLLAGCTRRIALDERARQIGGDDAPIFDREIALLAQLGHGCAQSLDLRLELRRLGRTKRRARLRDDEAFARKDGAGFQYARVKLDCDALPVSRGAFDVERRLPDDGADALAAIDGVKWLPESSRNRIRGAV